MLIFCNKMEALAVSMGYTLAHLFRNNVALVISGCVKLVLSVRPHSQLDSFSIVCEGVPKLISSQPLRESIGCDALGSEFAKDYNARYSRCGCLLEDSYVLVSEYVEGVYFTEAFDSKPLDTDLVSYCRQMMHIVSSIHEAGYCHDDLIGYGNVLLTNNGKVFVIDCEGSRLTSDNRLNDYKSMAYLLFCAIEQHPSKRDTKFGSLFDTYYDLIGDDRADLSVEYKETVLGLLSYYSDYSLVSECIRKLFELE